MTFDSHNNGLSSNNLQMTYHNGNLKSSSSTYQNVIHKKQKGTLILTEDGYTFYPIRNGSGSASASGSGHSEGQNGAVATAAVAAAVAADVKQPIKQTWLQVTKHQVSPVTHARHLLKIILQQSNPSSTTAGSLSSTSTPTKAATAKKTTSTMFEFATRDEIEKIRKDISHRLLTTRKIYSMNHDHTTSSSTAIMSGVSSSRKRSLDEMNSGTQSHSSPNHHNYYEDDTATSTSTYTHLTKSQSQVASSSLLASYPTLRTQHLLLTKHHSSSRSNHNHDLNNTNNNNNNTSTTTTPVAPTISNNHDFWATHAIQQSNQFSKIIGITSRGLPSTIKSSLEIQLTNTASSSSSKKAQKDSNKDSTQSSLPTAGNAITLGVEEMKQIFIMYPAVHAAYEEKVPLELSEELFWRKYLESEYFHRDRGKLGMSARTKMMEVSGGANASSDQKKGDDDIDGDEGAGSGGGGGDGDKDDNDGGGKDKKEDTKMLDENVRVATASSNDIFSRKELELKQKREQQNLELTSDEEYQSRIRLSKLKNRTSEKSIAVGQFDLTTTANTERGSKLLLHTNGDTYPFNDCGKKVIEKYNKHWAMVLNPKQAVAGCDLSSLARKSATVVLEGDNDANAKGGMNEEMERLVHSATAASSSQNGNDDHYYYGDNVLFEELTLKNINAYSGQYSASDSAAKNDQTPIEKQLEIDVAFSNVAMKQVKMLVEPIISSSSSSSSNTDQKVDGALPDKRIGMQLLTALTKKLVEDSKTEKDAARMTNELPQDFRKKFTKYFRRSSELLRHFYALRRLMETEEKKKKNNASKNGHDKKRNQMSQKLGQIANGLEDVYREMEGMKNTLPSSDLGERMRKMFIPIMNQLDWASKLHKDGVASKSGPKKTGGFGFVDVD